MYSSCDFGQTDRGYTNFSIQLNSISFFNQLSTTVDQSSSYFVERTSFNILFIKSYYFNIWILFKLLATWLMIKSQRQNLLDHKNVTQFYQFYSYASLYNDIPVVRTNMMNLKQSLKFSRILERYKTYVFYPLMHIFDIYSNFQLWFLQNLPKKHKLIQR